jgi:hypothetical protein
VSQINSQLRELLEQAVGEPPRHIAVPAVRRRVIRRRITDTAAAAIAVVAVAVGGTAVAARFANASGAGAAPNVAATQGAPRYYLQVIADAGTGDAGREVTTRVTPQGTGGPPAVTMTLLDALLVRSSGTGAVTGRISCPEGAGWWVDETGIAAVTDRTFVVACIEQPAALKPDVDTTVERLFWVRLTVSGRVAAMSPVLGGRIAKTGGGLTSMAATPDGREVAFAYSPGNGRMDVEVLNTVTGRRALWRGPNLGDYWGLSLTSDGRELVFTGAPCLGVGRCSSPATIMAVSPATGGGSLASARVIAGDESLQTFAAVSPDGSTVTVLTALPGSALTVRRISARTGRVLQTLYSRSVTGSITVGFLSADPTGRYLIVNATVAGQNVNGWLRSGRLIPLQFSGSLYSEAW